MEDDDSAEEIAETEIAGAFVTKYAASGTILHFKGGCRVLGDGSLRVDCSRSSSRWFSRKFWFGTLDEAVVAYKRAVERAIASKKKQLKLLEARLSAPTLEVRGGESESR